MTAKEMTKHDAAHHAFTPEPGYFACVYWDAERMIWGLAYASARAPGAWYEIASFGTRFWQLETAIECAKNYLADPRFSIATTEARRFKPLRGLSADEERAASYSDGLELMAEHIAKQRAKHKQTGGVA